jgi:hypothetical protein
MDSLICKQCGADYAKQYRLFGELILKTHADNHGRTELMRLIDKSIAKLTELHDGGYGVHKETMEIINDLKAIYAIDPRDCFDTLAGG